MSIFSKIGKAIEKGVNKVKDVGEKMVEFDVKMFKGGVSQIPNLFTGKGVSFDYIGDAVGSTFSSGSPVTTPLLPAEELKSTISENNEASPLPDVAQSTTGTTTLQAAGGLPGSPAAKTSNQKKLIYASIFISVGLGVLLLVYRLTRKK